MSAQDMPLGERIARAALVLVGAPFRLHGRVPETGLDCVGLCLLALRGAGCAVAEPEPYTLRGEGLRATAMLRAAGLAPVQDAAPGDILLAQSGPMQRHLMIAGAPGLIHAHAGLGRVVLMPGPSPWPVLGRWRVRSNRPGRRRPHSNRGV